MARQAPCAEPLAAVWLAPAHPPRGAPVDCVPQQRRDFPFPRGGVPQQWRCLSPRMAALEAWGDDDAAQVSRGEDSSLEAIADPTGGALLRATGTLRG